MTVASSRSAPAPSSASPMLVRWPVEDEARRVAAEAGRPCLLLVEPGTVVRDLGSNEDWIERTADERDVSARLTDLVARCGAVGAAGPVLLDPMTLSTPPAPEGASSVDRAVALLLAAPEGLVTWFDLGTSIDERAALADEVGARLAAHGWWLGAVGDRGLVAGRAGPDDAPPRPGA